MTVEHAAHPDLGARVYALAVSPDGSTVVSIGSDGYIRVADAAFGDESLGIAHARRLLGGCAMFSPTGDRVVVGGKSPVVYVAGTKKKVCQLKRTVKLEVRDAAFSPDGTRVATTTGDIGVKYDPDRAVVDVWSSDDGTLLRTMPLAVEQPSRAGWRVRWLDDQRVAVHDGRTVRVFSVDDGAELGPAISATAGEALDVHAGLVAVPATERVEVDGRAQWRHAGVDLHDVGAGTARRIALAQPLPGRVTVRRLAFGPRGAHLAMGVTIRAQDDVPNHSLVVLFDVAAGTELRRWELLSNEVTDLAFAGAEAIVTGDDSGELHRWLCADGDLVW